MYRRDCFPFEEEVVLVICGSGHNIVVTSGLIMLAVVV